VIFKDTMNRWNPCPEDGEIRATNPCGEYIFLDDTACNLASLNLLKFEKKSGEFDIKGFEQAVDLTVLILELTVSMASYPSEVIAKRSLTYRTLGLGVTNLGALLMKRGLAYDSDEGRSLAQCLVSLMSARAWLKSCEMACELTPYPAFKRNKGHHLKILQKHANASKQIQANAENQNLKQRADDTWKQVVVRATQSGVRHAQTTLIAPTGTISLIMDCDTMGIEPEFSLRKKKFLSGGGELILLNSQIDQTLDALKYPVEKKQLILEYLKRTGEIKTSPELKKEHYKIFDCARDISVNGHLLMMASLQRFLSGGISKTINLPADFSIESIGALYKKAHKLGLKAVALYREHSKMSEPLVSWQESSLKCHQCGQKNIVLVGRCYLCQDCGETSACA